MEKYIKIIILLFGPLVLSQSVVKSTFASSGGVVTNGTETIHFTIGEPIIDFVGTGPSVDQGFWATVSTEVILDAQTNNYYNLEMVVYPNPIDDHFYIQTNSVFDLKLEIFNILGQRISSRTITPTLGATKIDSSLLSSGAYMLSVTEIETDAKKIIKLLKN